MLVPRRLIQGKQFSRRWESPASLLLPGMQHGPWLHHAAHHPALPSQQPRPNPGSNAPAPGASDFWHAVRRGKSKQQVCSGPSLAAAAALPHAHLPSQPHPTSRRARSLKASDLFQQPCTHTKLPTKPGSICCVLLAALSLLLLDSSSPVTAADL